MKKIAQIFALTSICATAYFFADQIQKTLGIPALSFRTDDWDSQFFNVVDFRQDSGDVAYAVAVGILGSMMICFKYVH